MLSENSFVVYCALCFMWVFVLLQLGIALGTEHKDVVTSAVRLFVEPHLGHKSYAGVS